MTTYNDLNKNKIEDFLSIKNKKLFNINILDKVDSTNSYLKTNIESFPSNTLLISLKQSKGRGRKGKSFLSNDDKGAYFSFLIKDDAKKYDPSLITIAVALLVSDTLDSIYNIKTSIKWVNDIYLNHKKIGGILTEGKYNIDEKNQEYFIIGIGININNIKMPHEIKDIASSILIETNTMKPKNLVIGKITNNLYRCLNMIKDNPSTLIKLYKEKMLFLGEDINVVNPLETYPAKLIGLSDKGELEIKDKSGNIKLLNSGEIQIKQLET